MSATLELTKQLIHCASVTPADAGCQKIIAKRLEKLKFHVEHLRFGEVDNLWARLGDKAPLIVFAGHTDVVPPGPLDAWETSPFEPTERNGFLYGRGATDMKSGLACMIVAAEKFIEAHPHFAGSIGFLITSDEEGPSIDGTKKVMETLGNRGEKIDYCVIGEASSEKKLGDQIRIGRRGSLHGKLVIHGKQGHVAYPHLAQNPFHVSAHALHELVNVVWDHGNESFPPTSLQISNIQSGTGALNVIPATLEVAFNFRFSTAVTVNELQERVTKIFKRHPLKFDLHWELSGNPFLTKQGKLIFAAKRAIKKVTELDTKLSTGGGTSDGRFIAPTGTEVIELGPINESVHQTNEHVSIADLEKLAKIYEEILTLIFVEK